MIDKQKKLFVVLSAVLLVSCSAALLLRPRIKEPISRTDFMLNTVVTVTLYNSDDEETLNQALSLCREYENRFSKTIAASEIYRLNHRKPEETTFTLSSDTTDLIREALYYSEISDGAYDPTIEPLSSLWNFTDGKKIVPPDDQIQKTAALVDWKNIRLEGDTITFLSPDTALDLGSIAKGFIADRMKEYLISRGVKNAIINLGGNVLCIGGLPEGRPFRIGLQKPFESHNEIIANLEITDLSVVSSGIYERSFEQDGILYHHILNPETGYPYDNQLVAVTIVSPHSVDGDALSTTCFSLGLEQGMDLINSLDGIYGYFITDDYEIFYSEGAEELLNPSSFQ